MKRWIYAFTEMLPPGLEARALLGGKGAGLAELTRAGFTVPPGFTITTEACRWFYEHYETWPPELEGQVREQMAGLEAATGRTFGAGPDRLLVSVRSGAAVSMPGMMDTVLNVGATDDAWTELVRCINAVFRSWMSERAGAYRARHHIGPARHGRQRAGHVPVPDLRGAVHRRSQSSLRPPDDRGNQPRPGRSGSERRGHARPFPGSTRRVKGHGTGAA